MEKNKYCQSGRTWLLSGCRRLFSQVLPNCLCIIGRLAGDGGRTLSVIASRCQLPRRGLYSLSHKICFPCCTLAARPTAAGCCFSRSNPTCEKANQKSPQAFLICRYKNNSSAGIWRSARGTISNRLTRKISKSHGISRTSKHKSKDRQIAQGDYEQERAK